MTKIISMSKKNIILLCKLIIIALFVLITAFILFNIQYEIYPERPIGSIKCEESVVYYALTKKDSVDWTKLEGTIEYIEKEYDCSDFRLVNLIRILYEYKKDIPQDYYLKIESILCNFPFWWDDEHKNSMCYWSENHQILFASAEYLIGLHFPNSLFLRSGLLGRDLAERAKKRIYDWLELRWKYGFSEYYSNVYYKEDIAAMINIIDYTPDNELKEKCKIILDLLLYDIASQSYKTMFVSTSSRAYKGNRQKNYFDGMTSLLWGSGESIGPGMLYGFYVSNNYQLPKMFKNIALDTTTVEIKQSNGLDVKDLLKEDFDGLEDRSLMMQWGMEAFINPEVVNNTIKALRKKELFSNSFLSDMRWLNIPVFRDSRLLPYFVEFTNPIYLGTALNQGNTYTFRTADYSMYTSQAYQPGTYGDQHHVFGVNVGEEEAVYHTHPARNMASSNHSPNFRVGYGRLPHSVQHKSVNLSIYDIPLKKNCYESELLDYTYVYYPDSFDSIYLNRNYLIGKKNDVYCAFIAMSNIEKMKDNPIYIQQGHETAWITEVSTKKEEGSFTNFIQRIEGNKFNFDNLILSYHSKDVKYELIYKENFYINRQKTEVIYDRYESPYINAQQGAEEYLFVYGLDSLYLNYTKGIRRFNRW